MGATARQAGSPGWPFGRRSRCASSTTSRSIPACTAWSVSSATLRQRLERDHGAAVDVEGVEPGTEVARDVGEALRVEQREDLVVLPPELAQPLDGQGLRRHHEAALDFSRVHEPIQDERRFDRLSQADFVGQQPAHGVAGARALRDVELVREESNASSEERAEAVGFAKVQEAQDIETRHEILEIVEIAQGETFEEGAFELERPQFVGRRGVSVRQPQRPIREARRDRRVLEGGADSDWPARTQVDGNQRIGVSRQAQRRARARELDDQRSTVERRHASDSQLGIETVGEVVPRSPGAGRILFHEETPRWPVRPPGLEWCRLRRDDVLGARAFRALPDGERHAVALAHRVEGRARAGGLVEEVFGTVRSDDEAETLVRQAFDGAFGCWHVQIL